MGLDVKPPAFASRAGDEAVGIVAHRFMAYRIGDLRGGKFLVRINRLAGKTETPFQDGPQQGVAGARIGCQPGNRRTRRKHQAQPQNTGANG